MRVLEAKNHAREWTLDYVKKHACVGAYFSGSVIGMAEDAEMPPTSDVDITIVPEEAETPEKIGKLRYRDTLLEVSFLARDKIRTPERVLSAYELAGSFRANTIIYDPEGILTELQKTVEKEFSAEKWVRIRCNGALEKIRNGIKAFDSAETFADQVNSWLFPAGICAHVILAAALKNPTVRLRYSAVKQVLSEEGEPVFYEILLDLLGCRYMKRETVQAHLNRLADVFDTAASASKTPFFFSADIARESRAVVIDGSQALIDRGLIDGSSHREAVFWMLATYVRCQKILDADAPGDAAVCDAALRDMLADTGIRIEEDIRRKQREITEFLPELRAMAEKIIQRRAGASKTASK